MTRMLFDFLRGRFTRRAYVANPADPTAVVRYLYPRRVTGRTLVLVRFVASWGVDVTVTFRGGRQWRTYDTRFWRWLFAGLEDAHLRYEAQFDDDPMGRVGDYL